MNARVFNKYMNITNFENQHLKPLGSKTRARIIRITSQSRDLAGPNLQLT